MPPIELLGFVWAVVLALMAIGMRRRMLKNQDQD